MSAGEFDELRAIFARLGPAGRGLGDDCALVPLGGTTLALSIDASVEGVHFRTEWLSFEEIGWRATAGALSDLAAAGAAPVGVLVSLGVPGVGRGGEEIMAGVGACAAHAGAAVLGGDLVRSERYLVDVAVLGTAVHPVRRRGAAAGDALWATGAFGAPGRALADLRGGAAPDPEVRRRLAHPEPRFGAGQWLAAYGARAMIDVSDGLSADAAHLAAASGVAVEIALERIPCWPGVAPLDAVASGEEYELVAALPVEFTEADAREMERVTGVRLSRIGGCTVGAGVSLTEAGRRVAVPPGWDHFAS